MATPTASTAPAATAAGSGAELLGSPAASAALGGSTGFGTTAVLAFLAVRLRR
ncbi:hypothetical protein OG230_18050 [Streptomyces sp. NBC_00234]|uniref:hypothetical protein n=1 Tax=Streptomyces sp. NBC_00234 TaxID=2903638 RepID=UPI002E2A60CB|nr:hypothetical protein [Streptomyces sp. NBC_00234]